MIKKQTILPDSYVSPEIKCVNMMSRHRICYTSSEELIDRFYEENEDNLGC